MDGSASLLHVTLPLHYIELCARAVCINVPSSFVAAKLHVPLEILGFRTDFVPFFNFHLLSVRTSIVSTQIPYYRSCPCPATLPNASLASWST
jgi:hypothetical protein